MMPVANFNKIKLGNVSRKKFKGVIFQRISLLEIACLTELRICAKEIYVLYIKNYFNTNTYINN